MLKNLLTTGIICLALSLTSNAFAKNKHNDGTN